MTKKGKPFDLPLYIGMDCGWVEPHYLSQLFLCIFTVTQLASFALQ